MLLLSSVYRPVDSDAFKTAVMADNPNVFFMFDDLISTGVKDETPPEDNGVINNTLSDYNYKVAGKYAGDYGLQFPISNNSLYYVQGTTDPSTRPDYYTVMGLVKLPTLSTGSNVIFTTHFLGNGSTGRVTSKPSRYGVTGTIRNWVNTHKVVGQSVFTYDTSLTENAVTSGTWYIWHLTWDGTISRFYLNGVEKASFTPATGGVTDWGSGGMKLHMLTGTSNMTDGGIFSAFAIIPSDIGASRIAAHAAAAGF